LLNKLLHERKVGSGAAIHGLLSLHGDGETLDQIYKVRQETERLFQSLLSWHGDHEAKFHQGRPPRETLRIRHKEIVPNFLSQELERLAHHIDRIAAKLQDEEEKIE